LPIHAILNFTWEFNHRGSRERGNLDRVHRKPGESGATYFKLSYHRTADSKPAAYCKRSPILAAIFSAASTLTPLARRSMFTMTSPFRIINPELSGAR